jgi:hypothetical protein
MNTEPSMTPKEIITDCENKCRFLNGQIAGIDKALRLLANALSPEGLAMVASLEATRKTLDDQATALSVKRQDAEIALYTTDLSKE